MEREALAAVGAIKEFYPYLYGFVFKLVTDHNPVTSLLRVSRTQVEGLLVGCCSSSSLISQWSTRRVVAMAMLTHYQGNLQIIMR